MGRLSRKSFVRRLKAKDEGAWAELVREFGSLVYGISARLGLKGEEREDHFQGTFLAALRGIGSLEDPARLAGWLARVAYTQAVDILRRRKGEASLDELERTDAVEGLVDRAEGALERLERVDEAARLLDGLASLDERCRRLLEELYLKDPGRQYAEIARVLGIPIGSIGPTRARCLQKLRRWLKRKGMGE